MSLNPKRQAFVREYVRDLNGTQAAIRAGYSPRTANEQAARLLAIVSVREAVDQALAERASAAGASADRIMRELVRVGFGDARKVLRWSADGVRLIPSAELDDDAAALVAEVAETKEGLRVKVHDKLKALNLMGQHLGMWKEVRDLNVSGKVDFGPLGDDGRN